MSKDIFIDDNSNTEKVSGDVRMVDGIEAIENRLQIGINWQLGEADIVLSRGVDYYAEMRQKSPNIALIKSEIREVILEDPAVTEIVQFTVDFDRANRELTYDFVADTDRDRAVRVQGVFE